MTIRTGNLHDLAVTPGDLRIGEYESGVFLVCPLCGPLWQAGSISGLMANAVGQIEDRHVTAKHDPGRFPYLSGCGGAG